MMFTTATLMSVFSFISLCLALPTSSMVVRDASLWDCPSGKTWYKCQNNAFQGCCSVDPCALPSCPDIHLATTTPFVTPSGIRIGIQGCSPGQNQIYQTSVNTISSTSPGISINSSEIWVSRSSDPSVDRQQVVTFSGIPSTAKNCQLNWTPHNQTLSVSGFATLEIFTVRAPLPATVTSKTIGAIVGETIGAADFSDWVGQKDARLQGHLVGGQNCSEQMNFMVQIGGDSDGDVQLQLDGQSGFYIEYDC